MSFTKARLATRPHRPRDGILRAYMTEIGVEWPEATPNVDADGDGSESEDCQEEDSESEESDDDVLVEEFEEPKGDDSNNTPGGEIFTCVMHIFFHAFTLTHILRHI